MVRLKTNKNRNSTDSIGERLRKARENKGVSLEEVHRATKIHPRVLEALEENRLETVLSATYVKAFLKNYAHYLGLDVDEVARRYSQTGGPKIHEKFPLQPEPILPTKERGLKHAIIVSLAVMAWLVILGFATVKFIHSYTSFMERRKIVASQRAELRLAEKESVTKRGLIPIPKRRNISLAVTTQKDAWLKVTQDGEVAFHGTLSKGSKETWQADREIILTEIGRPEALSLSVNGKDIDFSGKRPGKKILITHEGISLESG